MICFTTAEADGTVIDICVKNKWKLTTTEQRPSLKTKANKLACVGTRSHGLLFAERADSDRDVISCNDSERAPRTVYLDKSLVL